MGVMTSEIESKAAVRISAWTDDADDAVDAFVAAHPEGLIYYTSRYRRLLMAMLGSACAGRLAWRGGRLTGVLPLQRCEGPWGAVLNTLPFFGSNGGVLAEDLESAAALRATYENLSRQAGVAGATWISHPFAAPEQPPSHQFTDERIAQWTMLSSDSYVLDRIDSSARRNVQKARGAGIRVYESADALGFLEQVHRENMTAIGGRQKPAAFFSKLAGNMTHGRDWRLTVAEHDGEKIAALLTFEAAQTVEYVMPAVREAARGLQPTDPPLWMRDELAEDIRSILLVGHMPHLARLLQAWCGGPLGSEALDFPLHGPARPRRRGWALGASFLCLVWR